MTAIADAAADAAALDAVAGAWGTYLRAGIRCDAPDIDDEVRAVLAEGELVRPICSPSPSRSPPPSPRCCAGGPSPPGRAAGYTDGTRLYRPALLRHVSPASRFWAAEIGWDGIARPRGIASRAASEDQKHPAYRTGEPETKPHRPVAASRLREPARWPRPRAHGPPRARPTMRVRRRGLAA